MKNIFYIDWNLPKLIIFITKMKNFNMHVKNILWNAVSFKGSVMVHDILNLIFSLLTLPLPSFLVLLYLLVYVITFSIKMSHFFVMCYLCSSKNDTYLMDKGSNLVKWQKLRVDFSSCCIKLKHTLLVSTYWTWRNWRHDFLIPWLGNFVSFKY